MKGVTALGEAGRQRLLSRRRSLDEATDLLDWYQPGRGFLFDHDRAGVVGRDAAMTVTVPAGPGQVSRAARAADAALRSISTSAGPGLGPVVVGALPFDGLTPARLTVPIVAVIRHSDGAAWLVETGPDQGPRGPSPARGPGVGPASLDITPVPEPDTYVEAVERARQRIRAGELRKVVLARMLVARSERELDRRDLLSRLRAADPEAYTFAVHGFIGASPELLVARTGRSVRANAVAGTAARGADADSDRIAARGLLASAKDRREHAPVVEAVAEALGPVCETLEVQPEPRAVATSAVWHLSTEVRGVLREPAPTALELAARLHPTPAVCGTPRDAALRVIRDLEGLDRTLYAGLVGWTDGNGDGEWAVILRCAEVTGRIAMLFAGAGIVADSDPAAELGETDAKFRSMLDALGYSDAPPGPPA
jgi:isochorismate synthase